MLDWHVENLPTSTDRARFADRMRRDLCVSVLGHDVEWVDVTRNPQEEDVFVLARKDGERLTGVAPFQIRLAHLEYNLGGIRVARKRVTEYVMEQGPITTGDVSAGTARCFEACARYVPANGTLGLLYVPVGSDLHTLLTQNATPFREHFHVMRWGTVKKRFKIKWEGSFDKYLASLKSTRRTKLRRAEKRFRAEFGENFQLKRYQTCEELDAFLDEAICVSDKTYQKQLLDLGVARGGHIEKELREAARRDYFRGHVFFVNGAAVAFQYALAYSGTIFLTETGYDPEWAQYEIGTILFCHVLRDFEQNDTGIHTLDFLPGVSVFKERTSNIEGEEQDFLLFRKNPSGSFYYWTMSAMNTVSNAFGLVLDRLRLKSWLKSLIQQKTGRGHI